MKREIIKIDEEKCNGCGFCIPNCHEGALQIVDGKARLVSELMCDGLGACIGHCPEGALEIETRDAEPYDEIKVLKEMIPKGKNLVIAHLKHLKDHNEDKFLQQGIDYLMKNKNSIDFPVKEVIQEVYFNRPCHKKNNADTATGKPETAFGGCPGSHSISINTPSQDEKVTDEAKKYASQLRQWPVQMHLINPAASYFKSSDLLLAADCVAYAVGDFHNSYLKGKTLAIACPKLDRNKEVYMEKLIKLIDESKINSITVMIMEVPCCSGLMQLAKGALEKASAKIPLYSLSVSINGEVKMLT